MILGFVDGMFVKPLVDYAIELDPAIVLNAVIITTSIFVCLSFTALYAK